MGNISNNDIPADVIPKTMTIDGMPTFEEQMKLKTKQRVKLEAKLAKDDKGSKDDSYVIGPTYLKDIGEALAISMKTSQKVTDFLKVQQFYADLKTGLYKALSSLNSYDSFKEFVKEDKFYSNANSDPCADIRNFISMSESEMNRFENSDGYKKANPDQQGNMKQNELSILQNYANGLNNSGQQQIVFVKKIRGDQDGIVSSFSGIGDFLTNVCMGYAQDLS